MMKLSVERMGEDQKKEQFVTLKTLIQNTNLAEVVAEFTTVTKEGGKTVAICPFHDDKKPSLQINTVKQLYYCFPCQSGGNVVNFLNQVNSWSLEESRKWLARRNGVTINSNTLKTRATSELRYTKAQQAIVEFHKKISEYFELELARCWSNTPQLVDFLEQRQLNWGTCEFFCLGFISEEPVEDLQKNGFSKEDLVTFGFLNHKNFPHFKGRLLFPITNINNDVVGFSGRSVSGETEPKYLLSNESAAFSKSSVLFNFPRCLAAAELQKKIYVVEGVFDVMSLWQANYRNVVGLLGSSMSKEQVSLLEGFAVCLALDSDKTGVSATLKILMTLLENNFRVTVLKPFSSAKDINEFALQKGLKKLKDYVQQNEMSVADFLTFLFGQTQPSSPSELLKITKLLANFLVFLTPLEQEWIANNLAQKFKVTPTTLLSSMKNLESGQHTQQRSKHSNFAATQKDFSFPHFSPPPKNNFSSKNNFRFKSPQVKKIVTSQNKSKWSDKVEIYELKILKALMENDSLRNYFNQKYFLTQHYFLNPQHNRFLQIQNLLLDEQESSEWDQELNDLEIKIHNITGFPTTIKELKECLENTKNPNIQRLNINNKE